MKLANAHWHFILSIIRITGSSDGFWCYRLIDFNLICKWKVSLKVRCGTKVYSEACVNASILRLFSLAASLCFYSSWNIDSKAFSEVIVQLNLSLCLIWWNILISNKQLHVFTAHSKQQLRTWGPSQSHPNVFFNLVFSTH